MGVDTEDPKGGVAAAEGNQGQGVVHLRMQDNVALGGLVAHRMNDRGTFLEGVDSEVAEL